MATEQVDLRRLTTTRGAHRGQMTKLTQKADTLINDFSDPPTRQQSQTFQGTFDSIVTKFEHLKVLDVEILEATETDDLAAAIVEADDLINSLTIKIELYKDYTNVHATGPRNPGGHPDDSTTTNNSKRQVNLPKLQLPKFDGNFLKWIGFIDTFKSAVDNDPKLDNVQKYQYLIAQLTGEAAKTVEGLQLTSANYMEALELLQKRYGQPHKLISSYMKALWELPKPTNSTESVREFYDNLESHIRGLRSLGKTEDSYGDLLVPIVFEKLPGHIKTQISRDHGDCGWTIHELKDALYREIQAAQAGNVDYLESGANLATAATFHVGYNRERSCPFCKSTSHYANECVVVSGSQKRREIAKRDGLCFNCLKSGQHFSRDCTSRGRCRTCFRKHNTALCDKNDHGGSYRPAHIRNEQNNERPSPTHRNEQKNGRKKWDNKRPTDDIHVQLTPTSHPVLLKTAVGTIESESGNAVVNILLDEGAQRSFITYDVANRLNVNTDNCKTETIQLAAFGTKKTGAQAISSTTVRLLTHQGTVDICALVVPKISTPVRNYVKSTVANYPYLRKLTLAQPVDRDAFEIDLLVGADYYWSIVGNNIVRGPGPTAVDSKLGFLLSGPTNLEPDVVSVYHTTCLNMLVDTHNDGIRLSQYWDLETIGITNDSTDNTEIEFEKFRDENLRLEGGKYIAKLPWRDDHPPLPTNYNICKARTRSMIRRLSPQLLKVYNAIITEQLSRDFIEVVPDDDVTSGHYIPHHSVKKDSPTTPIRIVYDCSCKTSHSPSLNDCLEIGPPLLNDLVGIILRFRVNSVAFTADIEKAFLNVGLDAEDRQYTKFLWLADPDDPEGEFVTYRFKAVLFGSASSPFILNAVLKTHLESNTSDVSDDLKINTYVDNVISGIKFEKESQTSCSEKSVTYYEAANDVMQRGGFKLRMWASNDQALRTVAEEQGNNDSENDVNVVGMRWSTDSDMLTFSNSQITKGDVLHTKREIVRATSSLYDPLGLLAPVHVQAKVFIQQLWIENKQWDEIISEELSSEWIRIRQELDAAKETVFARRYFSEDENSMSDCELHVFADASTKAYGAAVYLKRGSKTSIDMAKTRVKPPKDMTLPRLELMAALIGARLAKFIKHELSNVTITKHVLWCDSQIVIHWTRSVKKLPVFVENRVREIRAAEFSDIKYCPTKENPADLLTRGVSARDLSESELWWHGPSWLSEGDWPVCDLFDSAILSCVADTCESHVACVDSFSAPVSAVLVVNAAEENLQSVVDIKRHSSLGKLLRVTAYALRFISKLKKSVKNPAGGNDVTVPELRNAKKAWIIAIQCEMYAQELKAIRGKKRNALVHQLKLFIDEEGIIRCGGRFQNADLKYNQKFPILIPAKHAYTVLMICDAHVMLLHSGVDSTVTHIRQTYWIPKIRQAVKSLLRKCRRCLAVGGKPYMMPITPPLPACRIQEAPPFSVTGVDFSGALYYKNLESNQNKAYVCLFTCAVTRGVHLEAVTDMTAGAFLRAFRRFASRRSLPSHMISDNASTFIAAAEDIREILDNPTVKNYLANKNVHWEFIPKRAPWFGGFYERLIGITKTTIKKVLGRACVNLDELTTLLSEVEAVVNDRPITYVTTESGEATPLTPSHLINGRMLTTLPHTLVEDDELADPDFLPQERTDLQKRADYLDKLFENCWKRWRNEYLPALRENQMTNAKAGCTDIRIHVGDIVLVHSDTEKRVNWRLAKVQKLKYGLDGLVRSADIKLTNGVTNRPIAKLYPLEVSADTSDVVNQQTKPATTNTVPQTRPVRQAYTRARRQIKDWSKLLKNN